MLSAQTRRLTLEEAEQIAMQNHPRIATARWNALAASQAAPQVRSQLYPQVNAVATAAGAPETTRIAAGGINNPIVFGRVAAGVGVTQLLWDGGRNRLLEQSSREREQAFQDETRFTRSDVLLALRQAYFDVLRATATVRIAKETVQARTLLAEQAQELAKAQIKSALDVSFAQVALSEARLLLESATNSEQAARADLASAMGVATADYLLSEPQSDTSPVSEGEAISAALRNRADLAALRQQLASAESAANAEHRLRRPTFTLGFTAGAAPIKVSDIRRNEYVAGGVNMSLPFLNGGLIKARELEAEYRARAANERVLELENRIRRDVRIALANLNTARSRAAITEQYLNNTQQALDLAQARYDLGLSSIVELSQAQLAQTSARIQQAAAGYEVQLRATIVRYQTGALQ
jgi:outer membrane protein